MKNSADLGRCYSLRPKAEVDNTVRDLQNSSYSTQPHSIIAKHVEQGTMAHLPAMLAKPMKTLELH